MSELGVIGSRFNASSQTLKNFDMAIIDLREGTKERKGTAIKHIEEVVNPIGDRVNGLPPSAIFMEKDVVDI